MPALSRRLFLGAGVTACGCLAVAAAFAQSPPAPSPSGQYICPPCGCSQDGAVFDKPGVCPDSACGMTLIPKPADPPAGPKPS